MAANGTSHFEPEPDDAGDDATGAGGRREGDAAEPFPDPAVLADRNAPGYEAAWRTLLRRSGPAVLRAVTAVRLPPADRHDVVVSVWAKAADRLPADVAPAAVGAWLARTARREALNHAKALRRREAREVSVADPDPTVASEADDALTRLVAAEVTVARQEALARFLADRTPAERTLVRWWAEDVRSAEIGRRLGISAAAARKRVETLVTLARAACEELVSAADAPEHAPAAAQGRLPRVAASVDGSAQVRGGAGRRGGARGRL